MKKSLLTLSLVAVGAACLSGAAFAVTEVSAVEPVFAMEDGAAVRLTEEYSSFGIRFSATIVDETKDYKMLILPEALVAAYDKDTTENKAEIVPYMIEKFDEDKLAIVDNLVKKDGKVSGSIVNILWENINSSFVGFAYYMNGEEYVVADRAADYSRSVVDVCENAIKSGDYDVKSTDSADVKAEKTAKRALLQEKIGFGKKQAAGLDRDAVYVSENFEYVTSDMQTFSGLGIALNDQNGSTVTAVENGADQAIQFTRAQDKYNLLVLNFGEQPANTYKLSFTLRDNAVDTYGYNNWKLMGGQGFGTDYGYLYEKYYVGNDTFEYYFTTENAGSIQFGIAGLAADKTFAGGGQMLVDNVCLQSVDAIPEKTYSLNLIGAETVTFDGSPFIPVCTQGVYIEKHTDSNPTLTNVDGKAVVNTDGIVQAVLPLGDVNKGIYKLKFDATMTGGFPAIFQIVEGLALEDGTADQVKWDSITTLYNAAGKKLTDFVTPVGNTYEVTLTINNDLKSVGFILIDNVAATEASLTLDNISFTKVDFTTKHTLQNFENGLLNFCASAGKWAEKPSLVNAANAHFDYKATKGALVTEDNNTYYQVAINSSNTYSRLNVGWFEAGTYTFSFRAKASGSNLTGGTTVSECADHKTSPLTAFADPPTHHKQTCTFTGEWTEYTRTITLTKTTFIKFGFVSTAASTHGDFTVCVDDFTVIKTA